MGENERQLCVVCKVYEKLLQEAGLYEKAKNKAARMLQIRSVVNCKDENFKAFLARIAQIDPIEYLDYYDHYELSDEKAWRFCDKGTGMVTGEPVETYDIEDPDEEIDDLIEHFIEDCETCVYYNESDDCCECHTCDYKKKETEE